jgi:FixJ family two-component response regulator
MCESLRCWLESEGLRVEAYTSAESFLAAGHPDWPGCLLLDVRMPGMSGLELQGKLIEQGFIIPVIIITGHGDVPTAVRATKAGAVDFLEKPVSDQVLLRRIRLALELDRRKRRELRRHRQTAAHLATLSPRERQVMEMVVAGRPNKQIATRLGITEKTVEAHRKRVMQKLGARNAAALVRLVLAARSWTGKL